HAVNPATTVRPLIGREAERMRNPPGRITIVRQLPKLFYAETVNLRLAPFIEAEPAHELLRERTPHALAEHRNFRQQIDAGFEVRLRLAFFVDTFVAGAHSQHTVALVEQQISAGELREDVDAGFFAFLAEPRGQT